MELVSIILALVFTIIIINNYHKAVLLLGPLFILFQPYMCLRYNSPAVSLVFFLHLVVVFVLFVKKKRLRFKSFPLYKAFVCLFISLAIGLIVSPHGIFSLLPWLFSQILSYLFIVIYYNELYDLSDVKFSLKSLLVSAALLFAYFLFELVTQTNPFIQSMYDLLGMDKGWVYPITERFGVIRTQSFMTICIGWGGFCCIMISVISLVRGCSIFTRVNKILYIMTILSLLGVYFSGSRSAYLFLVVIMINLFFDLRGVKKVCLYLCVIIGGIILMPSIISFITDIFGEGAEGSSMSMRQMQFLATFSVLTESPLWGFGIKGYELAVSQDSDILGAESIWLQQLINYGIIGVVVQVYIYKSCWNFVKECGAGSTLCMFLVLGWVLFCTLTTSPGLNEQYFLIILVLMCKVIQYSDKVTASIK